MANPVLSSARIQVRRVSAPEIVASKQ